VHENYNCKNSDNIQSVFHRQVIVCYVLYKKEGAVTFAIILQTFTGVYGVGPATAKKWIKSGISSIKDAAESVDTLAKHDTRILAGNIGLNCMN